MSRFEDLAEQIGDRAKKFGCASIEQKLEQLVAEMKTAAPPVDVATALLKTLRGERCFGGMLTVARALERAGVFSPQIRIYQAQAFIDTGKIDSGAHRLEVLKDELEPGAEPRLASETLGLLGRAAKQRFVNLVDDDPELAAHHLKSAVDYYRSAYDLDPAWHGANLVALAWRAKEERIEVNADPERAARKLLDDLGDPQGWGAWDCAAAGQAQMALEQWPEALATYGRYVEETNYPFVLGGDRRQLREIWLLEAGDETPGARLLSLVTAKLMCLPDGNLQAAPLELTRVNETLERTRDDLQDVEKRVLEGLIGGSQLTPRAVLQALQRQEVHVCQVVDRRLHGLGRPSGGTGFLVHSGMFRNGRRGAVLVTNSHVLSKPRAADSATFPEEADAIFHAWPGGEKRFPVGTIHWTSAVGEYDVAIAELRGLPADTESVEVARNVPFPRSLPASDQDLGRAYLIGHPGGRGLEYSMERPKVMDHDLHEPRGVRRVHYTSPTEHGSSGSPVFDGDTVQAVGVHRAEAHKPIAGTQKAFEKEYRANEGVGLHALARATRESDAWLEAD